MRPDPAARAKWMARRLAMEAQDEKHTPFGPRQRHWNHFKRLIAVLDVTLRASGLYGRGMRNALDIRRHEIVFAFDDLPPAFDGYRLLHLTDPHFDSIEGTAERIATLIADQPVDLFVLTGDYRRRVHGPHDQIMPALETVIRAARASDGILATLGNHDTAAMAAPFEALGIRVLHNETVSVRRGDAVLHLTGFDDVHYYYTPDAEAAAAAAPAGFRIALVHSPEFALHAARAGYRFYLCGHTHGGQICRPGGKPILTASAFGHRFAAGGWRRRDMHGYTSRGAGTSGLPVRFFSRGEVTVITLRRVAEARG
jgi:predicted MPP superfamily phosphohydrolase